MKEMSVLRRFSSALVRWDPFPHFVLDDALPPRIYDLLAATYPAVGTIFAHATRRKNATIRENHRYDIPAAEVYRQPHLELGAWRDFVSYHTSQEFLDEVMHKLGDVMRTVHPALDTALRKKRWDAAARAGVRHLSDNSARCDVALDCQIGVNSPVSIEGTSVIGPHIDNPKELYAGLFYLRDRRDDSAGGDLTLYSWNDRRTIRFYAKRYVDPQLVTPCSTIAYRPNRFVWLLNGLDGVHGVTCKQPSPHPRRLCNIIAEVYPTMPRLFEIAPYQAKRTLAQGLRRLFGA